jgi:hypothetical protein
VKTQAQVEGIPERRVGTLMRQVFIGCGLLLLQNLTLGGCSVYMEATRPTPVDLAQFQPGDTHDSVVERLGTPRSTANEADGASCDFYELYTHGYGAAGKVGIAVVEGAADFFTLGLAEAISTPAEGITRNETCPVAFCYRDQKLARISESGQVIASAPVSPPSKTAQAPAKDTGLASARSSTEAENGSPPSEITPVSATQH